MKKPSSKFIRHTAITFAARIFRIFLGLLSAIIIARFLRPEGRGIYSMAMLLPALLVGFGNLGFGQASVFYTGKKKYAPKNILETSLVLSFILGLIAILIGLIVIYFFGDRVFPGVKKTYLLYGLVLIPLQFAIQFVSCLFLGLQKIKQYNFFGIVQSVSFLILLLIYLVLFNYGIKEAIIANILSCLFCMIIILFFAGKTVDQFKLNIDKSYVKDAFKYGFKIYLGNITQFLLYKADLLLINLFVNPLAVGLYITAVGLAEKIWLVSQSAATVLFPTVSCETDAKKLKEFTPTVCRNVLLITFAGAIFLFLMGRFIVILLFTNEYSDSVLPFQVLLIGVVAMSGWRIIANDLYGRGRPEINIYISIISVVLNVILNILWIPKYNIVGAAWATSVSYSFAFWAITLVYIRISGNNIWDVVFIRKSDLKFYVNMARKLP